MSNRRPWGLDTLVPVVAVKGREICSEVITPSTLIPACLGRDGGEEEEEPLPSGGRGGGRVGEKQGT